MSSINLISGSTRMNPGGPPQEKGGILDSCGRDTLVYRELEGNERNSGLFSELHGILRIEKIPTRRRFPTVAGLSP
ncbi:hypothetical protein [Thermococcus peptonophilus]|uniref:hypothetical protein n=1 Tax=Thermococcus peptonophilus TaxID=53952 RepID=UPI003467043B